MCSKHGYNLILFCAFLAIPSIESASRRRLNEYIEHYESLEYDADTLHQQHLRARRSTEVPSDLRFHFRAHGKTFHMRLRPDLSAFSDDLKVIDEKGQLHEVDTSHIYSGELIGDPQSTVFGSVTDGVFEGKIVASDGSFYVEHARRYFPPNGTRTRVHSVIYREGDVRDPYAHEKHGHDAGTGVTKDGFQWMKNIQYSGIDDEEPSASKPAHPNSIGDELLSQDSKYSRSTKSEHLRSRRGTSINRNTCSLFIHTDPYLWQHIRNGISGHNDAGKNAEVNMRARAEILSLISHHVTAVKYIFSVTKFDGRYEHRNINFEVQRIKIDTDFDCYPRRHEEPYPFCQDNLDDISLLNLHSLSNHEDFCLAYMFTYRNFTRGNLGLAWVASASGASGGICEKYKTYTETIEGMYQSTKRSLNTGIITFNKYNTQVPPIVSLLTLAKLIGHSFGSPHDYPSECRPGGQQGNFIMFASATSGDRPNNSRFSSCSIGNISQVLDAIQDGRKCNCFTASTGSFCGNKIVEAGEECDCGYDDNECVERCCYPRMLNEYDREKNITAKGCTRKANTQCSPSQGPCCHAATCQFIPASRNFTCSEKTECSHASYCTGFSADCPGPTAMDKITKCHNGTKVCINGECNGSVCLLWNMTECFLSSATSQGSDILDRRALCHLACNTAPGECQSSADFALRVGLPKGGISLAIGSPCDDYQGYCDESLNCQTVERPTTESITTTQATNLNYSYAKP